MRKILAVLFSALLLCTCGAILSACGEPPHEHNFNMKITGELYLASDATCSSPARYYYVCTCWEHSDETYEYGTALGHSYTNYIYNNDAECEVDGTETALCDYGCGESHTRTKLGSALTHNYGDWISNGDDTHTKTCSHDNAHKITENCSGGTATCSQKAVCSSCNSEYGNLKDHPYSKKWTITETHHYHASTCDCEEKKDYGKHTPDDSGFCTACDKGINYTKDIIYDYSSDRTYAMVVGYEGVSTKINIAPTYNNLPVKSIYDSAFESAKITKVIIPNSVTSIGDWAFEYCDALTSIEIPDSVTTIGEKAFEDCSKLTSVTIGGCVTSIGNSAFKFCYSLTSIEIPDSVTYIGEDAFSNCYSLSSITIGDSVTTIGEKAFEDCYLLTSVTIGDSVTSIGFEAFYDCNLLTSVTFTDTSTWYRTSSRDDWANKTGGSQMDVTNPTQIASYLKQYGYYWYKL